MIWKKIDRACDKQIRMTFPKKLHVSNLIIRYKVVYVGKKSSQKFVNNFKLIINIKGGKKMYVKKIKSINNQTIRPNLLCNDPHGRLIAVYLEEPLKVFIVSMLELLNLMYQHRQNFPRYSLTKSLGAHSVITALRSSQNLQCLAFTQSVQETQFLVVGYINNYIDMCSVESGNVIMSIDIGNVIGFIHVIGHSIYATTYDLVLHCYEGKQLREVKGESIRLGFSKNCQSHKTECIYQSPQGQLYVGQQLLEQNQAINNSYEQYCKLETVPFQHTFSIYTISLCHRFIVVHSSTSHKVRYRGESWQVIYECKEKPLLNHFSMGLRETIVATLQEKGRQIHFNRIDGRHIGKFIDAKHVITDLWWVGPKIILFLDEENHLFYLELSHELFQF